VTPGRRLARRGPLGLIGESGPTRVVWPPNLDRHVVYTRPTDHRDFENNRVAGLDPYGVVAGDYVELPRQDRLRQLGQVERRGLPTGAPPEPRGDGDHAGTFNQECFRGVTRPESLSDGAEVGGYLRNLNVISPRSAAAVPSVRATAWGTVVPLTPDG